MSQLQQTHKNPEISNVELKCFFLVSNNWRGCEGRAKEGKKCDGDSRSSKKIWNQFVGRLLGEKGQS